MRTQVFSSNGEEFTVFTRDVKKGETVTLGSNFTAQSCVNYFAAVFALPEETTTTETTTTTTETTTTTTTTAEVTTTTAEETTAVTTTAAEAKQKRSGDVNCDSKVDVSDAVLLARFNAEDKTASVTAQGKENADCDGVSGLTGGDVTMILKYIAKIITEFPA